MKRLLEWLGEIMGEIGSFLFEQLLAKALEKVFGMPVVLWLLVVGCLFFWLFSRLEAEIDTAHPTKARRKKTAGGQPEPLLKMLLPLFIILFLIFVLPFLASLISL